MKQVQSIMSRWIRGCVTTASMFVFSVSLASGDNITTAPTTSTPYSYSDPTSTSSPSYNNVGRPVDENANSLALNNQELGLAGPVTVSGGYSANYGYEMNASFSHMLGFYDAISLLGAYAPQENRIDITWAHAWTENQRTKLSVERLAEEMDFDYDSGSATEWVPQYSYGAGYQYLFNKNWLKNVELTGYYAQAQSQDLSTVRFSDDNGTYDNYRHIAGAISKGSEATLNVSPWKTGLVGLGLNYDSVNYDTKYADTDAEDSKGFGFTLSLEQLLSKHVKLDLEGSQREVYDDYVAGVSFLTPANLEVGINGERTLGENGSSSDSRFNLNLAYFFDDKNRYENGYSLEDASQNDLASWASKSVAYMDEVLAAADQQTVRILESSPAPANNSSLQSVDNTPVITLISGEINRVDISDYIESSNLTESQKQATPTIAGGPAEVEFTYDNGTQSLITTTEVPDSAVEQEAAPLVLVFPADEATTLSKNSVHDALTDRLAFKVNVTGSTPQLNPAFQHDWTAITSHAVNQSFDVYNVNDPSNPTQNSTTMYINPNLTVPVYINSKGGYVKFTSNPNNCYAFNPDDTNHKLTVTSSESSVCPGSATIEVHASNGAVAAPVQTINFNAQPASTPFVAGAVITTPTMLGGQIYSPGYAFPTTGSTNVVSPGEGQSFSTTAGDNTLTVYNASTCAPITDSKLELSVAPTQITLQSSAAIPTKYVGTTFKLYLSVKNTAGGTANNGTSCGSGTPFTATVQGPPSIPNDIPLGAMTVDTTYSYDFMTKGGVTAGSSPITSIAGSTITVKDSNGVEVSNANLGLALQLQSNNHVVLAGIVNPGYAGDKVYVTLNLTNAYGSSSNSAAPAVSDAIVANSSYAPSVAGGQTLTAANQYSTYTYTFPNTGAAAVTAGLNEKFDTAATYATVTGSLSGNLTSKFALTFNNDYTQITLTSGTNTLAVKENLTVVLHVANIDHQLADNEFSPDTMTVVSNDPQVVTTGVALNNAIVDGTSSVAYEYSYTPSPMSPGPTGSGQAFDTTNTKALVYYASDTSKSNPLSGFSLEFNTPSNTAITKLKASASTIQNLTGPINVYYQAANTTNPSNVVKSTSPDTIGTDKIVVPTTTLPDATIGVAYTYDFTAMANNNLLLGSTGLDTANSSVTFSDDDAGLSAVVTANDIVVSGTPVAGHAGSLKMTLNLQTPADANGNKLTKSIETTIEIKATTPVVTSGDFSYNPSLGDTFNYTFANSAATANGGPVVSAGAGEYFDEDTDTGTTFTVTGATSGPMTSQFHLVYSSDAALTGGNGGVVNNHNNVVSLVSNAPLASSEELTVTFNVKNVDTQTASGSTGTVSVGSNAAYLYCPAGSSAEVVNRQNSFSSSYDNPGMTGTALETINFTKGSSSGSGLVQLYQASIANNQLQCVYIVNSQPSSPKYIGVSIPLTGMTGSGAGWNGSSCAVPSNATAGVAATSCQVTYTYPHS